MGDIMKNIKKILFGFMLILIAFVGITACNNDIPTGDDLGTVLEEDYSWLIGTWNCSTEYNVSSGIDAINDYIPDDEYGTIIITQENLEEKKEELLKLINEDSLYDELKHEIDDIATAKIKANYYSVINEERTKVTIMRKYKASVALVISAKATVTITWEKQ